MEGLHAGGHRRTHGEVGKRHVDPSLRQGRGRDDLGVVHFVGVTREREISSMWRENSRRRETKEIGKGTEERMEKMRRDRMEKKGVGKNEGILG